MARPIFSGLSLTSVCLLASLTIATGSLQVSISKDPGGLVLSWPAWAADGVLEQSSVLDPAPSWSLISPALYQSNAVFFSCRIPEVAGSRFYRVRRVGPPVPGLTGYWRLDEGSGSAAVDQTGLAASFFMTNAVWALGRFGHGSLRFSGMELNAGGGLAWVSNTNYRVLPGPGQPFSLSLWFSPDSVTSGSHTIVGNDVYATNGWHVALNVSGPGTNYLVLTGRDYASSLSVTGRTLLLPGQWHQLVLTCSSNQASLFLDGSILAQAPRSLLNNQGSLYLGAVPGIPGTFSGCIDEVRTYSSSLDAEQISITGQWSFDEGAGELAADRGVEGHPGSVTVSTGWVPGKSGSGIDLGLSSVVIPNEDFSILPASGGPFSLSFWLRPRALPASRIGLLSCAEGSDRGWQVTVDGSVSGQNWLEFTSTSLGGTLALRAPLVWTNGQWTKFDLTYNGGIAVVYINGRKIVSESGAIQSAKASLALGIVPGLAGFDGVIDELKVYNRERAEEEIGPVARPMWETAFLKSSTDLVLLGAGPPGKHLTYSILSSPNPIRGTISYSPDSPVITYQAGEQKGPDSFAYVVSDGEFTSAPATAVVSVVQAHFVSPAGGTQLPLDGSNPERAWCATPASALDAIWKTNNYYDCFFYAPGEYQTTGCKFNERSTANPGCKHIGSQAKSFTSTIIKLVNTWGTWSEGAIFGVLNQFLYCDGFEVHNMVLDCNAQNNPKYAVGEPVWLRIPLTTTALVNRVTLHWVQPVLGSPSWKLGPPAEFSLCSRSFGPSGTITNCQTLTSTGTVDVVNIGNTTDELILQLNRRANGVDFYGLIEAEVQGATVSLPIAASSLGGESRLDSQHNILRASDGDPSSSWASGPEEQVQITLPLEPGTRISQINLRWNCETLPDLHRLGPASQYFILARDPGSGQLQDVPFVSRGRSAAGAEVVTFGTGQTTNSIITDQLVVMLTARAAGVDYYSLQEVTLQNGVIPVPMRLPSAMNSLSWNANYPALRAFDGDAGTAWASGTQGSVTAINLRGSNLKFSHLKIIGFGTKALRECAPLAIFTANRSDADFAPLRNILIEDCLFAEPATNNTDGISAISLAGPGSDSLVNGVVRRCTVLGLKPYFTYSHGIGAPFIEDCIVDNCQTAIYFEPDPSGVGLDSIGPVMIRSNRFSNVVRGVGIDFHPGAHFESVTCIGNEVILIGAGQGYGFTACDVCSIGPSGTLTNLTALNNIVRFSDWLPRPSLGEGGFMYTDIQHAVYGNNLVALGTINALRVRQYPAGLIPAPTTPEDCDHPGIVVPGPSTYPPSLDILSPPYRRAWYSNRDLSGALLPVRQYFWGVDREASQQQWLE